MRKAWTQRSILSMQTPPEQNIMVCRRSFQYFPLIIQQVGENSMVRHTFLVYLLKVPLQQPYQEPIRCLQKCWVFKTVSLISEALLCPKATALPTLNVDREHKRNIDVIAESIPQIFLWYMPSLKPELFFFFFLPVGQVHPVCNSSFDSRITSHDELSNFRSAVLQPLKRQMYYL